MDRDSFIDRFDNQQTKDNYLKAFKKLDYFLETKGWTEEFLIRQLTDLKKGIRYEILQSLIDSISREVSPRTVRDYFDRLFKYFLLMDCELDYTQKKLLLKLPRIIQRRLAGLDRLMIEKELSLASDNFGTYIRVLSGGGLRETEGLKLEPSMIYFNEYPVRLDLPAKITKFSIPRETFLPPKTAQRLKELIEKKGVKENKTIFVNEWTKNSLKDFEVYFDSVRSKAGFETKDRVKHQQNDITLHSHRAFYITRFEQNGFKSFGYATAGHSKDMTTYFRLSMDERRETFGKVMGLLDF